MSEAINFVSFCKEWLEDVIQGEPSTVELGRRFARKLITQWLDIEESSEDIFYCDGSGDGGIDIAYLSRGQGSDEGTEEGDTWYLVQSKYGTAFSGSDTLLIEAQKIIDTLDGKRQNLSSLTKNLLEKLINFREQSSEKDKLILVFATNQSLNEEQKRALNDIRAMGINRIGTLFDVESVSIETIYQRLQEPILTRINIPLNAKDAKGDKLIVGAVKLTELYKFMKNYRDQTGDLDQLYDKNVRRFLGTKRKVNSAIKKTLEDEPENFGLYNNGVTLVVENFEKIKTGFELTEPHIVNGCQTTKTIWEVLSNKLESGGTGTKPKLQSWKEKADQGTVIVKIVKVSEGEEMLTKITRYTNSQNVVSEKDFLALTQDFRTWAKEIEKKYGFFLEIQRGGWDSKKALQKQKPNIEQLKEWANAFDLIKVYGAGWLGEAGLAFGTNSHFLPNGSIFKKIMDDEVRKKPFGINDFYAAYLLQKAANETYKFGRRGKETRTNTRFVFYMIVIDLLKASMIDAGIDINNYEITEAFLKLFKSEQSIAANALLETAIQLVDEYMTVGQSESIYNEPDVQDKSKDVGDYLRWEKLGKTKEYSPQLLDLLAIHKRTMKRSTGNQKSPFDLVLEAIKSN